MRIRPLWAREFQTPFDPGAQEGRTAVAFKVPREHAFAVASVLMDLNRVSPLLADEVVIYHDGLRLRDRHALRKIQPIRFVRYRFPVRLWGLRQYPAIRSWTTLLFASFDFLLLLEEFETVIQLDYDLVLQEDISEMVPDSYDLAVSSSIKLEEMLRTELKDYDLSQNGFLTWSFSSSIGDPRILRKFCYDKLAELGGDLNYPEMAIFGLMAQRFGLTKKILPSELWTPHPFDAGPEAKVLHSYGHHKFWTTVHNSTWEDNQAKWVELGGSEHQTGPTLRTRVNKALVQLRKRLK